ncbi:MAG: hypothetical protein ACREBC_39350, partial [Pyrinomonadaceae bacterium]
SLCGVGKWDKGGVKVNKALLGNFPRAYLDELRTAEGKLQALILTRWFRHQKPQCYEPKSKAGELPCRTNFNKYELRNVLLHATLDRSSGNAAFFSFWRIPEKISAHHIELLELLGPSIQRALIAAFFVKPQQ